MPLASYTSLVARIGAETCEPLLVECQEANYRRKKPYDLHLVVHLSLLGYAVCSCTSWPDEECISPLIINYTKAARVTL